MACVIYLIDGTGPEGWAGYWSDMERGFCARIKRQHQARARYLRGPTIRGLETWAIADIMLGAVQADLKDRPKQDIVLAGHSRGGAAVIYLARKLADAGVAVKAMILFDAVRRATQRPISDIFSRVALSGSLPELAFHTAAATFETMSDLFGEQQVDRIPGNVARALHFVRDERYSNYFLNCPERDALMRRQAGSAGSVHGGATAAQARQRLRDLDAMHHALRDACRFNCRAAGVPTGFSFGNTGLKSEAPCRLTRVSLMATHGGMGGAPLDIGGYIKDPKHAAILKSQEASTMREIWARTEGFLQELGAC
jgi:pimeloyl-ACP methyl ester carboxylesterase